MAFIEIDRPSMPMVVENVFFTLGLIYTMKVSYNVSFIRMEVVSFVSEGNKA